MSPRTPKLGPIIQRERKKQRLTLEQLANRSGVSKSMLSQIERGEANPTFAVVWSLTNALKIEFSELVGGSPVSKPADQIEVTSAAHTPEIRSADGNCRLRILSSPLLAGKSEWYEVELMPHARLDSDPHSPGTMEHFTAMTDGVEISSGDAKVSLKAGETARYAADVTHSISNHGDTAAKGFLVVLHR